jgi:AAA domain/Primase C terminal 1 (PriCT-1)
VKPMSLLLSKTKGATHAHLMFKNVQGKVGTRLECNWHQLSHMIQTSPHRVTADKGSAPLFAPWTPVPGVFTRTADAVDTTVILVFDLDKIDTVDIEAVLSWCQEYSAVVHTTFSHGIDGLGCYRIYIPLSRPVGAAEYKALHAALLSCLPEIAKRVDPTCAEITRCYFVPSCHPDRSHLARTEIHFGCDVDADGLLAAAAPPSSSSQTSHQLGMHQWPSIEMPPPVGEGLRNSTMVSALGSAYAKGFTPEAVLPVALEWGALCSPPMDPSEIMSAVTSMWKTHNRNHPQQKTHPTHPAIRLLTVGELLSQPIQPQRIKGLLPKLGVACLYGQSGSGKSFLAIDVACAIACGVPSWFGMKVQQAPVVYVVLEGSGGFPKRLQAYLLHHSTTGPAALRVMTSGLNLTQPSHVDQLASEILKSVGAGGVVFIDTLNQSAPGADENSSAEMGAVIANAKALAETIDGLTVLIHHSGKDQSKGMRGHSSIFAAMDAVIEVTYNKDGRAWQVTKSKDGESGAAHGFELVSYVVGKDSDGDEVRSCAVRQVLHGTAAAKPPVGKNQKLALAKLKAQGASSGSLLFADAVRAVAASMVGTPGRCTSRAKEAIEGLIDAGHIELNGGTLIIPD